MKPSHRYGIIVLVVLTCALFILNSDNDSYSTPQLKKQNFIQSDQPISIDPITNIKPGNRWIVVTSISSPTEDVKRLATFPDWNLVVVGDTKTPANWSLEGVHFLSVEYQKMLPFKTIDYLPFKSYTRKNIGYLYAISQGANWIYDTDDDNKPYGLGLKQFDYDDEISGLRYRVTNKSDLIQKLFNPYRFFGRKEMWPRGFPLEYLKDHTNGKDRMITCEKMKRPAVQQGLVHHDPDVDAIYRLQHADPKSGLDERFNKFAPPITLSPGTYSPWNSQNTLFHKSAFHTLFLPTTVSFRTTDIWRSYYAQKILHLSGLSVSFTPVNAVQFRNAHDYLKDFKDETQVYDDAGKIVKVIDSWECSKRNTSAQALSLCMKELAELFVKNNIWKVEDANLIDSFLFDLKKINYTFPPMIHPRILDSEYELQKNESSRDVNCRKVSLHFELDYPEDGKKPAVHKAEEKIKYFGDIDNWCEKAKYTNFSKSMPSPNQLAEAHSKNPVLTTNLDNVLIITNNFEWKWAIGLLQRMYQPYFGHLIFCGSYYPEAYKKTETDFPPILEPFNYVHVNPAEIFRGYHAYHCLTLVKEMKLSSAKGYFIMSDDVQFNIWQQIDFKRVYHLMGVQFLSSGQWWDGKYGMAAAKKIVEYIKSTKDEKVLATWKKYEIGLRANGYLNESKTAFDDMLLGKSRSISDFFYVPSAELDYFADLMRIFYKFELFLELAVNKFLRSVKHQTSKQLEKAYLWGDRGDWSKKWNADFVGLHPIKLSQFGKADNNRMLYCSTVLQTWRNILIGGSTNYTMKKDSDPDWLNG